MSDNIRKDLFIIEIEDDIELSSFCCESEDLNKFLYEKAKFMEENLTQKNFYKLFWFKFDNSTC